MGRHSIEDEPFALSAAVAERFADFDKGEIGMAERPNPLGEAASKVGTAWSAAAGVVSALVTFGALTVAQGNAIAQAGEASPGVVTAIGTVLAGALPLISGIIASFRTASAGKELVTPVVDPRDNQGNPLTPDTTVESSGVQQVDSPYYTDGN
jgi:hypothetical protein